MKIPKGSKMIVQFQYDNSPNNKYNPDPTKAVKWGDQTWEEMMIGWMSFVYDSPPPATKATETRTGR